MADTQQPALQDRDKTATEPARLARPLIVLVTVAAD
jgi:hypothetical protein